MILLILVHNFYTPLGDVRKLIVILSTQSHMKVHVQYLLKIFMSFAVRTKGKERPQLAAQKVATLAVYRLQFLLTSTIIHVGSCLS